MTDAPKVIERIQKRSDFLAAARASSYAKGAVVMQARDRADDSPVIRVGFTATRKIGGAVVRNRAKRRLRALARAVLASRGRAGWDYVLIGRETATASLDFAQMHRDLSAALDRVHGEAGAPRRPRG